MGSASRYDRCARFMEEFKNDIVQSRHLSLFHHVVDEYPGVHEGYEQVHYYVQIRDAKGDVHEFMSPDTVFSPEEGDEDVIQRTCEQLLHSFDKEYEVKKAAIVARLKKCGVIDS